MFLPRTLILTLLFFAVASCKADGGPGAAKEKDNHSLDKKAARKKTCVDYTFHLDNTLNKDIPIDSVLIILDKYDLSGAGIVKKIFYPNAGNQIVIEDLPKGKYYAEVYVLGMYKKHFSSIIRTAKSNKKNKAKLHLDFKDTYTPGNVSIPKENQTLFAFYKK